MSKLNLELVKMHLRLNHSLEDELLSQYLKWAKSTVIESFTNEENADLEYLDSSMQFQKAVIMLTGYYYEQRMPIGEVRAEELPYTILDSIQRLRANPMAVKGVSNE